VRVCVTATLCLHCAVAVSARNAVRAAGAAAGTAASSAPRCSTRNKRASNKRAARSRSAPAHAVARDEAQLGAVLQKHVACVTWREGAEAQSGAQRARMVGVRRASAWLSDSTRAGRACRLRRVDAHAVCAHATPRQWHGQRVHKAARFFSSSAARIRTVCDDCARRRWHLELRTWRSVRRQLSAGVRGAAARRAGAGRRSGALAASGDATWDKRKAPLPAPAAARRATSRTPCSREARS
jgi:hypothetical protein